MDHLGQNRDVIVGLNDVIVIVVERGQHRWSAGNPGDTPLDRGHALRSIVRVLFVVLLIGFKSFSGFRRKSRHPSVLGISNDGSAFGRHNPPGIFFKGGIIIAYFTGPLSHLKVRSLGSLSRLPFKRSHFIVG